MRLLSLFAAVLLLSGLWFIVRAPSDDDGGALRGRAVPGAEESDSTRGLSARPSALDDEARVPAETRSASAVLQSNGVVAPLESVRVVSSDGLPIEHLEFVGTEGSEEWTSAPEAVVPANAIRARAAGHAAQDLRNEGGSAALAADALLILHAPELGAAATGFDLESSFGDASERQRAAGLFVACGVDELALAIDVERWRAADREAVTASAELSELTTVSVEWTPERGERRAFDVPLPEEWIRPRTAPVDLVEVGGAPFDGERAFRVRVFVEQASTRGLVEAERIEVSAQVALSRIERTTRSPRVSIEVPTAFGPALAILRRGDGAYGIARFVPTDGEVPIEPSTPTRLVARMVDEAGAPQAEVRAEIDPRQGERDRSVYWSSTYGRVGDASGRIELVFPRRIPEMPAGPGVLDRVPSSATLRLTPRGGPTVDVPFVTQPGETVDLGTIVLPVTARVRVLYGDVDPPAPEAVYAFDWGADHGSVERARALGPREHELLLEAEHAFTEPPPFAAVWIESERVGAALGLARDGDAYVAEAPFERDLTLEPPVGRGLSVRLFGAWNGIETPVHSSGRAAMTEVATVRARFLGPDAILKYELRDPKTKETVTEGEFGRADALPELVRLPEPEAHRR